jgi:hypothetical protein
LRSPLNAISLGRLKLVKGAVALTIAVAASTARADGLIVYGDKWAFSVVEPKEWHGDIQLAERYQVNIVFLPEQASSKAADVTIRIRVNSKTDEEISKDLAADMEEYRAKYPKVTFTDLAVSHARYPVVSKLMSVRNEFFEYVAYLNPGKEYPYVLSVAMSKARVAASTEELAAFRKVLASLQFMRKAP